MDLHSVLGAYLNSNRLASSFARDRPQQSHTNSRCVLGKNIWLPPRGRLIFSLTQAQESLHFNQVDHIRNNGSNNLQSSQDPYGDHVGNSC